MKAYILFLFFVFSCFNGNNNKTFLKNDSTVQRNMNQKKISNENKKNVDYQNNDTVIIILKKINFKLLDIRYNDTDNRVLLIQRNNKIVHKINLLTQDDYMGFSINWIKDIGNGFEISTELGRYYYQKDYQFIYENDTFYLKKIETNSFDNFDKESKNFTGKKSVLILEKPLNIDDFDMTNFVK